MGYYRYDLSKVRALDFFSFSFFSLEGKELAFPPPPFVAIWFFVLESSVFAFTLFGVLGAFFPSKVMFVCPVFFVSREDKQAFAIRDVYRTFTITNSVLISLTCDDVASTRGRDGAAFLVWSSKTWPRDGCAFPIRLSLGIDNIIRHVSMRAAMSNHSPSLAHLASWPSKQTQGVPVP